MENNTMEKEAFDAFSTQFEDNNGTDLSYEEFMKAFEDSSDNNDNSGSEDHEEKQDEQLDSSEGTSADDADSNKEDENTDQPEFTLDYQKLYEQNKQTYEAQLNLVSSRLRDLSEKYQKLKEQKAQKAQEPEEIPPKLKEFYESYPDIAEAVKTLVDSKLNKTVSQVEQVVTNRVQPIEQNIAQESARQHIERIRAAHPDVIAIMESGDLVNWIQTLPAVQQEGAIYIYNRGTADQIIELLNTYKSARRGAPKGAQKAKVSSTQVPQQQESNTDEIVNRVLAAMNVPTSKDPISLDNTRRHREKTFDDAVKEYEATRRTR